MSKIAVFVGSLQKNSFNKKLADALERESNGEHEFIHVDLNMPLFNQDLEAAFPKEAQAAKDIVEAADAVLFVTPEYNRGVPGVLKNAIDWTSRPWGSNSFAGKPAAIAGASISPLGTAVAQNTMRHTLTYLDMKLMGQPELYVASAHQVFDDEGEVNDAQKEEFAAFMSAFTTWIK